MKSRKVLIITSAMVLFTTILTKGCKEIKKVDELYPEDNKIEEVVEQIIERKLETLMGLGQGTLKNKVDLTFWSSEDPLLDECYRKCEAEHPPKE